MAVNEIAKKRVYDRISEGKDGEAIARATFYLDKYIARMNEDTKTADNNPNFYRVMAQMYAAYLDHSDGSFNSSNQFQLALSRTQEASTLASLAKAIGSLTHEGQRAVVEFITAFAGSGSQVVRYSEKAIGLVNKVGGTVALVALCALQLTYEAIKNIRQWYNGEISGKRCAKNLIDTTFTIAAGVGGGAAGAALGSLAGPVGTIVGAFAGGIIASNVAEMLGDYLTRTIFDLPKDVAAEKAYSYFGLSQSAPNNKINEVYRGLCLKYHPDKQGGDHQKFLELQSQMAIIKAHREEL